MHELSIAQSILEIALRHAEAAGASRVTDLYLVIGDLSSVVDDSVQFHWEMIVQGTPAEGSRLHFERVSARFYCGECDFSYTPPRGELACPQCGEVNVRIIGGDEFRLEAIEVDMEAN